MTKPDQPALYEVVGALRKIEKDRDGCVVDIRDYRSLEATLDTTLELLQGAQKDYRDLLSFLAGKQPETYGLHVKEAAKPFTRERDGLSEAYKKEWEQSKLERKLREDAEARFKRTDEELTTLKATGGHERYVKLVKALVRCNRRLGWVMGAFSDNITYETRQSIRDEMDQNEEAIT